MYEKKIGNQIIKYCDKNNVTENNQSSFCKGYSCESVTINYICGFLGFEESCYNIKGHDF